jgi:hypothetical protein
MQFTLCLSPEAATRIASRVSRFGGSVPGYSASLAEEMSLLPLADEDEIRTLIRERIKQHAARAFPSGELPKEWQLKPRRVGRKRLEALAQPR